jgi:branched-chain amino acid transport system substrate-binding protein
MPAEVQVRAVADMLTKAGLERAAILSTTDAIGTDGAELLKKSGLTIVGAEEMEVAASDVTTQLAKLRAQQPEALVVWGSTPNTGIAVKNAGQLGMNVPIVSGNAGASPENANVAAGSSALERWISVGVVDSDKPLSRQEDGVERLLADHPGSEPDIYSALGYDGIMLFAEALKHAGDPADRDAVRTGIEAISGFETLAGIYTYGADKHEGLDVNSIIWLRATPDGYDRVDDPLAVLKQ